ncbi:MAG: TonB-dependent receptor, partial [Janthinobacterium sp.]
HDEQKSLKASQRSFAKSGIINFNDPKTGKALQFINGSSRSAPANASVNYNRTDANGNVVINPETNKPFVDSVNLANPYALAHGGKCAPSNMDFYGDGNCYFDSPSTIEINPESKRDSLFSSGSVKLGKTGWQGFYDFAYTEASIKASIAPYPADFSISPNSPLFSKYLAPQLSPSQLANAVSGVAKYRLSEMGNRVYDYGTKATHLVGGVEGSAFGWDINTAVTYSKNKQTQDYVSGFPLSDKFNAQIDAGNIDPFAYPVGSMPDAMRQALLGTGFSGTYNTQTVEMKGIDGRASRPVFSLPGGTAMLGVGADYRNTSFKVQQADVAKQAQILFDNAQVDSNYARDNAGAYAELMMPISKKLEMTGSVRYDQIGAIDDKLTGKTVGKKENATTWKVSGKYSATKSLMFRAAAGTGFRAASMQEIAGPLEDWGVTGGNYQCPLTAANGMGGHPLASYCSGVGRQQFEAFQGGNPDLKPETSKQGSVGFVIEPVKGYSASFDYWAINTKDRILNRTPQIVLANYQALNQYIHRNPDGTIEYVQAGWINAAGSRVRGLDVGLRGEGKIQDAKWTATLDGTYMDSFKFAEYQGQEYQELVGKFYTRDLYLRWKHNASFGVSRGDWSGLLIQSFSSGYKDQLPNGGKGTPPPGFKPDVSSYTTYNLSGTYTGFKNTTITVGIQNLFDRDPPFTAHNVDEVVGAGWDPRVADPRGRSLSFQLKYKFM